MRDSGRQDILETIHDVGTTLDDALNIKEALSRDIVTKKTQIEKFEDMKSVLELEVKDLGDIRDLSSQLSAKDKEIFLLKEMAKNFGAEKAIMVSSEKDLVSTLEAAKRTLAQVESSKRELWKKVQSLQDELGTVAELKREFDFCSNEKDVVTEKLKHMEVQLQSAVAQNSSLTFNMESTRETFEDLRRVKEEKDQDCQTLERALVENRVELASHKDAKMINAEKIGSLQSQLDISTTARDKLERALMTDKKTLESLLSENIHLKEKMLELEEVAKPSKEFISRIDDLKAEKNQLSERGLALQEEIASLQVVKTTLEGDLRGTKKSLGEFKFSQEELRSRLEEMTKEAVLARGLELQVKKLREEKIEVMNQLNALHSQVTLLGTSRSELEISLEKTKSAFEKAEEEKVRLQMRFSPLVEKENMVRDLELELAKTEDDKREGLSRIDALEEKLSTTILEVKSEVKEDAFKVRERETMERENARLKRENEVLNLDSKKGFEGLDYIKKSLVSSEKSREGLESRLEGRKSTTRALEVAFKETEALKKEIVDLKKQKVKGFSGLDYIKQSLAESEKSRENLESRLEGRQSVTKAFEEALQETKDLKDENATLKARIDILGRESGTSAEGLDFIKSAMNRGDVEFKEHIATLEEQLARAEESKRALETELSSHKEELGDEVETLKDENARLKASVRKGAGVDEELERSEDQRVEFKKELGKTKRQTDALETQLKKIGESRQMLDEEFEEYKAEKEEELETLKDVNSKLKDSARKGEGADEALEKSEEQRAELKKEISKLASEIDLVKEENVKILEKGTASKDVKAALEKAESESKALRHKVDKFKEDIENLEKIKVEKNTIASELENIKKENDELNRNLGKTKISSKDSAKLKKIAAKQEEAEQALEKSEEQRVEFKKELDNASEEIESLREEKRKLKKSVPDEALLIESQNEIANLKKEVKKFEKKAASAEREISTLTSEKADLKKRTTGAPGEGALNEIEGKLEKAQSENDSLLGRIDDLNTQIEELNDAKEDGTGAGGASADDLKRAKEEAGKLTEQLSDALSKLDKTQSEKDELVSKLDGADEKIEELEEKVEDLA